MIRAVMTRCTVLAAAALAFAASPPPVRAQGQFDDWKETAPIRAPKTACRDLRALTDYTLSIDAATAMAARGSTPEFCQITGLIVPEVRFEVSLPAKWNGRLYMFGNGGYAGENLFGAARLRVRDRALAAGFAVAQTDTGHDAAREPLASFALDPQKLADYAYRAVHVTAVTAKHVARTYYGSAVDRAYFQGCSTGGRQGLISAQRFPADFDGIVVGAPVLDFTGTMIHYAKMNQALRHAPGLIDKVGMLASRIYSTCDAQDGLADGVIDDPRRCAFDPATDAPACTPGASDKECLTPADVTALEAVYRPVVVDGVTLYPGLPLVNWVERGVVPDRLVAAKRQAGSITRTRPLCPYPQVAKYTGSGSVDEAANFECRAVEGKGSRLPRKAGRQANAR
jgi:feruloyl esterase